MAVSRIVSSQMLALAVTYSAVSAASGGSFAKSAVPLGNSPVPVVDVSRVSVSVVWVDDDAVEGFPAVLRVSAGRRHFERRFDFGLNAEILWSPDPNRFAVTGSWEGANGQYRTAVVDIAPTGLRWVEVTAKVERRFGHPVRCGWPEVPNVVAVTWLSRTRLVLAAQIIDHSNCDSFGTFKAYVFDVATLRLGRSIDQLEAKRRWSSRLGAELADARDECIRSPSVCFVAANHVGGK